MVNYSEVNLNIVVLRALPVVLFFGACPLLKAAVILGWDMNGEGSPSVSTSLADTLDANLDSSSGFNSLARTGVTASTASNSFSSTNWNLTDTFNEVDDFFSFSLLAKPGYRITFESLSYVISGSNSAPATGRWGYRIANGAFTLQNTFTIAASASSSSIWDFPDFTTTEAVELRFWANGTLSINGATSGSAGVIRLANIAGNDLILNGSVDLIPEPSASMLMIAGLAGLVGVRAMRRKNS